MQAVKRAAVVTLVISYMDNIQWVQASVTK